MRLVPVLAACCTLAFTSFVRPAPVSGQHEPAEATDEAAPADLSATHARLASAVTTARKLKLSYEDAQRSRSDLLRTAAKLRREAAHARGTTPPPDLLARMAATIDDLAAL